MDHMRGKTFLDKASKILVQSARKKQRIALRKKQRVDDIIVTNSYDDVIEQQKLIRKN